MNASTLERLHGLLDLTKQHDLTSRIRLAKSIVTIEREDSGHPLVQEMANNGFEVLPDDGEWFVRWSTRNRFEFARLVLACCHGPMYG